VATTAQAYIPSSSATARRTAAARSPSKYDETRLAITSVSVSVTKVQPSASSRRLSGRKFSMMPLWINAIRPRLSTTGWAFSLGRLAVRRPARVGDAVAAALPAASRQLLDQAVELALGALAVRACHRSTTATPAES
jgi:hypothetical protein